MFSDTPEAVFYSVFYCARVWGASVPVWHEATALKVTSAPRRTSSGRA